MKEQFKNMDKLGMILIVFFLGLFVYSINKSITNLDTDKTRINTLSSFTVKDNPNAEREYELLVAYQPKTDKGEDIKIKRAIQKLDELNTLGKK